MVKPAIQWLSPEPLWNEFAPAGDKTDFRRPALLRFASDTFMNDLQAALTPKGAGLRTLVASPETWQNPAAGIDARKQAAQPGAKLYQAVHQRFYLVATSLTCRQPGLPDHKVDTAAKETATFVLRRYDPTAATEWAWTDAWQQAQPNQLTAGEERLPLFPVIYDGAAGKRRMFAGMIPTGRRQQYTAAKDVTGAQPKLDPIEYLMLDFERRIGLPWQFLISQRKDAVTAGTVALFDANVALESAFILEDLAAFIQNNFPIVWNKIQNPAAAITGQQKALYQLLNSTKYLSGDRFSDSLPKALNDTAAIDAITSADPSKQLPPELANFKLTDEPNSVAALIKDDTFTQTSQIENSIRAAAAEVQLAPAPDVRQPQAAPVDAQGSDWYVIRAAYERPECGQNAPAVLSAPTEPFQMASFFDPDAPARQVQVALPFDTSPATLKKYDKNVAFMISDQLANQMSRVKDAKKLIDGKIDSPDGLGLGFICSFSIPIITLVAFMLLILFVIVLNIVFFWLPFFKICFPVPKKA